MEVVVEVYYGDDALRRLAVDAAFHPDGWTPDLVRFYRRRLQSLMAARDREELSRVLSLRLRSESDRSGTRSSIRLINGSRLLLDFNNEKSKEVTVVGILVSDTQEVTS